MNNLVKQGYNLAADNYAVGRDMFKNSKYLDIFDEKIKPGSIILDIGCGNGNPVDKYLSDHGHSIIGIDISEKQIELAKKNFPNQTFELKDMSEVQMGKFRVDAVVSFYAIFHIPNVEHARLFEKINSDI